ncbi:MAG: hypothetical protein KAJ01_06215, partial [Candidatus Hydrogenedentes bacterium]|nr:hypothetical protein [Candidatus Hydrogenedentota bacterium]
CFIATAAYGTPAAKEISVLRDFRDKYLLTNRAGAACVRAYYRLSPPVARFIAARQPLRAAVRVVLAPIVAFARFATSLPVVTWASAIAGLVTLGLGLSLLMTKTRTGRFVR